MSLHPSCLSKSPSKMRYGLLIQDDFLHKHMSVRLFLSKRYLLNCACLVPILTSKNKSCTPFFTCISAPFRILETFSPSLNALVSLKNKDDDWHVCLLRLVHTMVIIPTLRTHTTPKSQICTRRTSSSSSQCTGKRKRIIIESA